MAKKLAILRGFVAKCRSKLVDLAEKSILLGIKTVFFENNAASVQHSKQVQWYAVLVTDVGIVNGKETNFMHGSLSKRFFEIYVSQ